MEGVVMSGGARGDEREQGVMRGSKVISCNSSTLKLSLITEFSVEGYFLSLAMH